MSRNLVWWQRDDSGSVISRRGVAACFCFSSSSFSVCSGVIIKCFDVKRESDVDWRVWTERSNRSYSNWQRRPVLRAPHKKTRQTKHLIILAAAADRGRAELMCREWVRPGHSHVVSLLILWRDGVWGALRAQRRKENLTTQNLI